MDDRIQFFAGVFFLLAGVFVFYIIFKKDKEKKA